MDGLIKSENAEGLAIFIYLLVVYTTTLFSNRDYIALNEKVMSE
jgi:hypothetical protein